MTKLFNQILVQLEQTNLLLRLKLELAEAAIPAINHQLQQFALLGALPDRLAFSGDIIQSRPYLPQLGPNESGQLIQAVQLIPAGIGIAIWDSEEYAAIEKTCEGPESEIHRRFQPFDACNSLTKALLLSQAHDLLAQLKQSIRMRID